MSKQILAVMIDFENVGEFGGVGVEGYDAFDDALGRAKAMMQDYSDDQYIKMMVAPEYYFSGHEITTSGSTKITSLTRDDKHNLYKKIIASSKKYPNILIIPGSIAYSKARGISKRKYYNVCPIAAGGEIIHKYYKQANDTFQSNTDFKTKNYGATFNHKNTKFGIDICLDHGHKKLKESLNGGLVDVHILIADGQSPSPRSLAISDKGVIVYCNMAAMGDNGKRNNGIFPVFKNKYGNLNRNPAELVSLSGQALSGGYKLALYRGTIG